MSNIANNPVMATTDNVLRLFSKPKFANGISRAEVAKGVGRVVQTARYQMEWLESAGYIAPKAKLRHTGKRGRPASLFVLTAAGRRFAAERGIKVAAKSSKAAESLV